MHLGCSSTRLVAPITDLVFRHLNDSQVLCGHFPYREIMDDKLVILKMMKGVRPKKPENALHIGFTEALWDTVRRCWREDWRARPDVEEILSCLEGAPPSWHTKRRVIVRKALR